MIYYAFDNTVNSSRYPYYSYKMCIRDSAEAGRIGCAAHQLAHDKITDRLPVVADDEDGLAHLDLLDVYKRQAPA